MNILQTQILDAHVEFFERSFVKPFPLRGEWINEITEVRAEVTVRVEGREATGRGAIYLGVLWSWPHPDRSNTERDTAMRRLCATIANDLPALCGGEAAHPLTLGLRLHDRVCADESLVPPALARAVCASPFDAAIHDAAGLALGRSAFDFYDDPVALPGADRFLADENACAAIRRLLQPPQTRLDAWLIVGPTVSLQEEVCPWVQQRGYHCFKLRIPIEPGPDVARTVEVYRAVREFGVNKPRLTVDSNEMHPDADAVRDYLHRLRAADADTFAALEYLEQPTDRDILAHRYDWRAVTSLKPVILDEGLISLELLEVAAAQGWSGFALKTCKGHSFSLVAGAWARDRGLALTLQDLTNPGLAAIHAALLAARLPTLNGIDLNSPQFTPAANAEWLPRLQSLLDPTDGFHHLPAAIPPGLGSTM